MDGTATFPQTARKMSYSMQQNLATNGVRNKNARNMQRTDRCIGNKRHLRLNLRTGLCPDRSGIQVRQCMCGEVRVVSGRRVRKVAGGDDLVAQTRALPRHILKPHSEDVREDVAHTKVVVGECVERLAEAVEIGLLVGQVSGRTSMSIRRRTLDCDSAWMALDTASISGQRVSYCCRISWRVEW